MIGAAEETPIAEDVLARIAARDRVVSLVGQVKLADLPSVLRACALFIGNDSGPKHIAASLGVPSIGIHSGVIDAVEWAPMGAASAAL
ncbi:glycosyltransferase family 9 protein, partial [Vibrio parahaemolyticus]